MANNVIPMNQNPAPVPQDWVWNGSSWVCDNQPPCQIPPWGPFPPPYFPPQQPPWYPGANAGVSFSPSNQPPPFPIRGNFWWDGQTLRMFDGVVWVPVGGAAPAPVMGVTDGSFAPVGAVGEVVRGSTSGSITNLVIGQPQTVNFSMMVVQPGDWDMMFRVSAGPGLMGVTCFANPMPAGMQDNMDVTILGYSVSTEPTGEFQEVTALSPVVQGNFNVPTLMSFQLILIPGFVTGISSINWEQRFRARRMR